MLFSLKGTCINVNDRKCSYIGYFYDLKSWWKWLGRGWSGLPTATVTPSTWTWISGRKQDSPCLTIVLNLSFCGVSWQGNPATITCRLAVSTYASIHPIEPKPVPFQISFHLCFNSRLTSHEPDRDGEREGCGLRGWPMPWSAIGHMSASFIGEETPTLTFLSSSSRVVGQMWYHCCCPIRVHPKTKRKYLKPEGWKQFLKFEVNLLTTRHAKLS